MMKNSLRALFGVSALALLFVATPVFAAQVDVTAENVLTGADSTNTNTTVVDDDGNVNVLNDGDVINSASASVNTGDNEQNQNTSNGDLETGAVDASTDWESVVNSGAGLCGCPVGNDSEISADFSNDTTGYDSTNENTLTVNMDGNVDFDNLATIVNSLSLTAETGDNEQNMNTTAGDLKTGDISLNSAIANWANSSDGSGSSAGNGVDVDVEASNHLTGAESTNTNTVTVNADGNTNVLNDADITNSVAVSANTGDNQQNMNTTAGSTMTGNISVSTDIENVANSSDCACPPTKSVTVAADLSNDTTGYDSTNENTVTVDAGGNTNVTNDADVVNSLSVNADSGNNQQNKNTTGGDVETGSVTIHFGVSNEVN